MKNLRWLGILGVVLGLSGFGLWLSLRTDSGPLKVTRYFGTSPLTRVTPAPTQGAYDAGETRSPSESKPLGGPEDPASMVLDEMPTEISDLAWQSDLGTLTKATYETDAWGSASGQVASPPTDVEPLDTLVVCPTAWQPDLKPWLDYRTAQGRRIGVCDRPESPEQLKSLLKELGNRGLRAVLLVGDVPAMFDFGGKSVPAHQTRAEVSHRFGGREWIPSDHWYADLDDDGAPELAVGRWSVANAEQLTAVIQKTIDFERHPDPEFAKRRIEFVAGVGGFGALEDKVIEGTATRLLTDLIPAHYSVGMTHASWRSVYCPGPDQYQKTVVESLNRGSLFWVYMGHGAWDRLDSAYFPDRMVPTITTDNVEQLAGTVSPIALLLACSTGEFDRRQDCLAEAMQRTPAGPVAVIAGSGVTAPYGLATFGLELLNVHRQDRPQELGEWIRIAKRRMILGDQSPPPSRSALGDTPTANSLSSEGQAPALWDMGESLGGNIPDYRQVLRQMAKILSPTHDILDQEVREHAHMMNLFGDPLLRLPSFEPIEIATETRDGMVHVSGRLPAPIAEHKRVEIEIVRPLDRLGFRPPPRRQYEADPSFGEQLAADYAAANDRVIHRSAIDVKQGQFALPLANISALPSRFWVRVLTNQGPNRGVGVSEVRLPEVDPAVVSVAFRTSEAASDDLTGVPNSGANNDSPSAEQDDKVGGENESPETISLYDGKSLAGWTSANFGGEGEVLIEEKAMVLEMGHPLTGVTFVGNDALAAKDLPRDQYELRIRAKKIDGGDFFCGVTFPVNEEYCSFIVGGWGGTVVGLSSIDGQDAARNATRSVHKFESDQWYDLRIKVTTEQIECWIDDEQVVKQTREGVTFSIRPEVRLSQPLGLSCFQTTAAYEKIELIRLDGK